MFTITQGKGFQMTFANRWTVSVQWGPGNYGQNHAQQDFLAPRKTDFYKSETAEVAAWDANNVWYDFGCDNVKGYLTADQVANFITKVSKF